jgi:hypothetical protein
MKHAIKDADNPFFRSKYADLASVVEASRPSLIANGLSVVQCTEGDVLWTMLLHESGEWIKGSIVLKPMRQVKDTGWVESHDPQSYGSCITYARRYAMAAITGVATEDDDGNAASGNKVAPKTPPVVPPVPPGSTQTPTVTIGTVQIPLVPPAVGEEKKDEAQLRHEIQELAAILSESYPQQYPTVVHAIQFATAYPLKDGSGEGSYKDVIKLKKWQLEKAIGRLNARLNAFPPPTDDDVIPEDDIKY